VVISIIDITEFTKAEGELRESESMLKEAQKVAHIGSWTLNPVTDEITWSDELFRIFGLVPGPEAPKLTDYHAFFDGTERDKFLSAIQKLLQDELDFEIELNIKRPSGEERTILSKGRIKHKENNEKLVVGTFQDITDRKKIEIELNNIDNLKTDYLIFISQQIRTPLDAVVGTLNLIKSQDHSTGIKKLLETLNESVSKLEDYTNKAILFSQLSQKKYLPKVNFLNLRELVQFAALELNSRIKEKHVILNIQVLDNTLFVNADRDLIFKALVFILDNALDYSSNDGKINVTFFEEETRVHCRIIDFGPGFTEDHLNMLMNPVHPIREKNFQKSGLSMFIVRLIMNIHGGSLQMYNTDQGGACVELELNK